MTNPLPHPTTHRGGEEKEKTEMKRQAAVPGGVEQGLRCGRLADIGSIDGSAVAGSGMELTVVSREL